MKKKLQKLIRQNFDQILKLSKYIDVYLKFCSSVSTEAIDVEKNFRCHDLLWELDGKNIKSLIQILFKIILSKLVC